MRSPSPRDSFLLGRLSKWGIISCPLLQLVILFHSSLGQLICLFSYILMHHRTFLMTMISYSTKRTNHFVGGSVYSPPLYVSVWYATGPAIPSRWQGDGICLLLPPSSGGKVESLSCSHHNSCHNLTFPFLLFFLFLNRSILVPPCSLILCGHTAYL